MNNKIIKTADYGWIMLLPCGIGDTVYRIEYTRKKTGRRRIYQAEAWERNYNQKQRWRRGLPKDEIADVKVIPQKMTAGLYPLVHKAVFLDEHDAYNEIYRNWGITIKKENDNE